LKINWISVSLLAGTIIIAGCGGGRGGNSIAVVNGEQINQEEFLKELMMKDSVRVSAGNQIVDAPVAERLGFQALQDLITKKITMQLAKDDHVYPDDKAVDAEIAFRTKLNPNFVRQLNANGLTLVQIKDSLRFELAKDALLTKGVTVTLEETKKFIKDNPSKFMESAKADLLMVIVKNPADKAKVDEGIATGQTFSAIAGQYSEDANIRKSGGRYPINSVDQMQPALRALVEKTPVNRATAWQNTGDAWVKFYVENKVAPKPMRLDDNKLILIQRTLAKEKGVKANDLQKQIVKKLRESKIDVNDASMKELWKNAWDSFIKKTAEMPTGTEKNPLGSAK